MKPRRMPFSSPAPRMSRPPQTSPQHSRHRHARHDPDRLRQHGGRVAAVPHPAQPGTWDRDQRSGIRRQDSGHGARQHFGCGPKALILQEVDKAASHRFVYEAPMDTDPHRQHRCGSGS